MSVPSDRKYMASHEWHKLTGDVVTIGISQFAADELTDVTYVDLPAVGKAVTKGKPFGVVESVKATSDLYCGVDGEVVEVNAGLNDHPDWVNSDPFEKGWMIRVKVADAGQLGDLLSAEQYQKSITG